MIVWLNGTFGAGKTARGWLRREADLVLDTTLLTAAQAALEIAGALPSLANRHS